MSKLNQVIQAIIFASNEPVSGYDIAKLIQNKTGNSHQQVYRELGRLAGCVGVEVEEVKQEDKPNKKLYSFIGASFGFVTKQSEPSDFSKTNVAYGLLVRDILDGTNHFDSYMEELKAVDNKYLELAR